MGWLNYNASGIGEVVDRFRWEGGCIVEHVSELDVSIFYDLIANPFSGTLERHILPVAAQVILVRAGTLAVELFFKTSIWFQTITIISYYTNA